MKLLDIYAKFKKDISYIEKELEDSVRSEHDLLNEASLHLLKAGGKRIRPVFVLLSGKFGDYDLQRLKKVAVALELIHMASLVHDDVIDDAATRRGKPTVKSKWDNRIAMYTGDYIFAKALTKMTELDHPDIHQILSKAIVQMSIGEMEQIRHFYNVEQSIRTYLLRIRRKTALLIAISCQLGAIATGAKEKTVRNLYAFGYNVGMAFQIRDDILDICGTEKEIGKPPGSDIRQGNITLPVIYSLQQPGLNSRITAEIERIRQCNGHTDVSAFIEMIVSNNGLAKAEQLSNQFIDKALAALQQCEDIKEKQNLQDIAQFVGARSY